MFPQRRIWHLPELWWVEHMGGGRLGSGQGLVGGGGGPEKALGFSSKCEGKLGAVCRPDVILLTFS